MYTIGKGKANVVYRIPAKMPCSCDSAYSNRMNSAATYFSVNFLEEWQVCKSIWNIFGLHGQRRQGRSRVLPLGRSVCELWRGLAASLASGRDLNSSHTLLERLRQERASSRPRVSWELAVHVYTCSYSGFLAVKIDVKVYRPYVTVYSSTNTGFQDDYTGFASTHDEVL